MLKAILKGGKHRRTDGEPVVIVNCDKGIDDVTYEIIHMVMRLGDVGWILI